MMTEKCYKLKKFQVGSTDVRRNFSRRGRQTRYFAHPFHVAEDTMQMHVYKKLCPFYTITKMPPATQGRNEGHKSLGAEPLWGRHKVPKMSQILSSIQYICFRKTSGSNTGRQTYFLSRAPSNLVTPLLLRQQSQESRFVGAAMLLFHSCFFSHCTAQNYEAYRY